MLSNQRAQIPYDDLREWIVEAERLGEVRTLTGLNWQNDIGDVAEAVLRADDGPAVIFDEVEGCPKGHRLIINVFAGKRRNMTLGFPAELTKQELSDACYESYHKERKHIPHVIVDDGPVFENVLMGDDVDVSLFPTPIWHAADGGRYIGTGTYTVTQDPDTGWINVGTYRAMIHDNKTVGCLMVPGKHGAIHRDKYFARGEPCPVAMIVGGDPITFFSGCTEVPYEVCEYDVVGGMRGKPVECVRGKLTGLPIPANAEIVLEGYIDPKTRVVEGPFGEWTGYYAGGARPAPVIEIKAIYHRNNPIILGFPPMGAGADELSRYRAIMRSAMLKQDINNAGVPDVTGVWCHEIGSSRLLHGIAIKQRYPGHAKQAGVIATQVGASVYANKYVVVVDDDVDVTNLEELMWAMITRSDPATSIDFIKGARNSPADARLMPEQRTSGELTTSRCIIDACRPFHWRDQFPKVNAPTMEQARSARERFGWMLDPANRYKPS
ncbi:MAG: UbiD family decarboxylase [Rhodospirillales bacterium]